MPYYVIILSENILLSTWQCFCAIYIYILQICIKKLIFMRYTSQHVQTKSNNAYGPVETNK
jgi:hypothetical protein